MNDIIEGNIDNKPKLYSFEAEVSLLGCLFVDNNGLDKIRFIISEDSFYFAKHQVIYAAMLKLHDKRKSFDVITLYDHLDISGDLEIAGGFDYLHELAVNIPSAANILGYATVVSERKSQREVKRLLDENIELVYNNSGQELSSKIHEKNVELQRVIDKSSLGKMEKLRDFGDVIKSSIQKLDERFTKGDGLLGVTTGLTYLDKLTSGLVDTDFIVIGARPSTGKTALGVNLAESFMMNSKDTVVIFSTEMPEDLIMQRLLSSVSGVPARAIKTGKLKEEHWGSLLSAVDKIKNKNVIIDDSSTLTPDHINSVLRKVELERGKVGMVLVDYIQLMTIPNFKQGKRLEITEISHALKATSKSFDCPVIALSQCTREVDKRPDKRPTKADLMEAGAIEADADIIITLYAEEVHNPDTEMKGVLEVIVCKNRNGELGTVKTFFDRNIQKIKNLTADHIGI